MWKEYLSFSKSERITFLSLSIIVILLLILSRGINAVKIKDSPNLVEVAMIREFYDSINNSLDSVKEAKVINFWQSHDAHKNKSTQYAVDSFAIKKRCENLPKSKKRESMRIEINSADTAIFSLLPGVGPTISSRIVKYRSALKGFYTKEQLLEVYGVDSLLYSNISSYLVVDSISIEKLNLNQISIAQMKNHPYLDFYQAKEVYEHRNKVGKFNSINDVLILPSFSKMNTEKLLRYFCVY